MRFELPKFVHRRSLSLACVTLLFSLGLTAPIFGLRFGMRRSVEEWFGLATLCSFNWTLLVLSLWNLIQDVERGYSPPRCSLAALLLAFAALPPAAASFGVLRYFL